MRILLDTHAFLWWISESSNLSEPARDSIADEENEVIFSVVSAWEISIKASLGKLRLPGAPDRFVEEQLSRNDMQVLPMYLSHALRVLSLEQHHRDPFDRLLIAQALVEGVPLISGDRAFARYPVETIW